MQWRNALDKQRISELVKRLEGCKKNSVKALIGFDGFIDEVVHVVKKRLDASMYEREKTLSDYGERISSTAGYSSNVEIVSVSQKLGGNGPIMANSMMKLGVKMDYIGAVGYPNINPVFSGLENGCNTVIPICQPASTDAVEFDDGKIIRCKLSAFQDLTFEKIKERVGLKNLAHYMDSADLIGFVNWALPPFSGEIWQGIRDEVVPILNEPTKDKLLFFDLADPASRPKEDLQKALQIIVDYALHYQVVLGLNLSEAVQVAEVFGETIEKDEANLLKLCEVIMSHMNIDTLVIHPVKCACCLHDGNFFMQEGPCCKHPKLTTGAGDNFNAGFVFGLGMGLAMDECLALGMANSGFYVRNAKSGSINDVSDFLARWAGGQIEKMYKDKNKLSGLMK